MLKFNISTNRNHNPILLCLLLLTLNLVLVACFPPNDSTLNKPNNRNSIDVKLTGKTVAKNVTPDGQFTGVWANNGVVVTLHQANTTSLTMTTDEGYVSLVQVHINDQGVLELGKNLKASSVVADVSFKLATDLNKLKSLQTTLTSQLISPDLKVNTLQLYSGGDSKLKLGNVMVSGKLDVGTSGESHITSANVQSKELSIKSSGGSKFKLDDVTVSGKLDVGTSGESHITLANLQSKELSISSSGSSKMEITGKCSVKNLKLNQGGESQFIRTGC